MNDLGRKNLRTWLQKSLANHPENDNGLVAYVEAIVGDAEGTDEDLREKWTEKLDDFLAESSGDFTNVLLSGVRSGKFDRVWRGGGGGVGVGGKENNEADSHKEIGDASGRDPTPPHEDEGGDGDPAEDFAEADAADGWVDDGRGWEDENEEEEDDAHDDDEDDDDDDDDEDGGGRSRRSRRRARDEEEEESSQSGTAAVNSKGSGTTNNNNKRARVQDGRGGGGGRGNNQNGTGGRGGRGGQQGRGQQSRGNMAMQMQAGARGPPQPMGAGSLAMGGQGMMMGPGPGPGPMPGMGMRPGPGQWGGGMNPGRGPGGMMFPGGGFGPGDAGGPNGPNGPNGMGMGNPMGPMVGPGPGMPGGGMPPGGMPGGGGPRGMPGGMPGGMAAGMAGGRGPGPGPGMQGGPQGGPGPGASGGGMVQGMVGGGRGMLMPGGSGPGMQQGGRGGGPSARSPGANGSMPGGPMPAGPGPGAGAGAGAGSNAPRGTGGLLPTPGVGGRGVPLLPGPGPGPRPQMARPDMAGGRGGGSLGLGRSIGPGVAGPSAGRGEGGRGVGMGMPMGMPMGGRGIGGGGRGGGPAEGGRMDNPIAGRSAQGQGPQGQIPQGQGPQRSPTAGPVNVNGGDPRAFGPSASGPPAGPRGPVTRQGDGGGIPRPGQGSGPGRQDVHGHGHGRPPGIVDGAQGPRAAFEGPNTRSGVGPGRGMQQGLDARQGFDNRPEMRMDARGRPDAPGLSETGRGPDAQGPREGFGGRQQPPQDGRNANASNSRSVFDRLGAPPSGEVQQDHGARRAPDAQRQHAGDAGGMRQGGGMQPGPPGQQRGTAQHAPDLRPRPGMAMQPGADTRQGPNPRPGPEIRRSPTENQGGPQRGQGMQRGPNVSGGMVMGNTHAQDGRGEGQGAWSGQRAVDMHRPGREQLGGAGRGSPAGSGGDFNGGDADRGRPLAAREHPRVEGSRGDQRGGNGSGRPGYVPDGGGRNVPPQERPGQGWAGQQGRGLDNHRQGQGQGQGHYPPQPGAQQHTAPRISPQGPAARLGAGPSGPAGNPHRGEQGRSTSEFARNGGGNGGPQQPMAVDGEGHARHQSQQQQQQQQQQVSSFQQQSAGGGRGADRGQQGSGGRGGAPPHTGGGSLAWGGFGVVKQEAQRDHSAGQGTRSFGSDRGTAGPPAPRAGQPTQGFSSQRWGHGGDDRGLRAQAPEWKGSDRGQPHRGRHGNAATEGGGWAASAPAARTTVRCTKVPAEVGPVELSQHFVAFGKIVDMRLRNVMAEGGGRGQKEALIQFANARQAQACVASPKAVLGNRFIVVELSDVNLVDADSHYHHQDTGETAAAEEAAAAKAAAAAAQAARRKEHERVMAQASKTREVVAQQRVLVQVEERSRASAASIEAARAKRDKVQGFLRMMQEKGKPEADQAKYRTMLDTLSARVLILETASHTGELQAQKRKMAELEAEARAIGATVPPPPNPAVLARLVGGTGRGSGADAVAGRGGRGGGRGRGRGAALASGGGRGGGAQVARSLDNRPTTVKVSGLPASAGEGDLRVHANMAGVVVAAAMLDRPGEGVVKFAERWTAEMFMSKSRSFGGIPLTMSWYTGKFPGSDSASAQRPTWQGSSGSSQIAQRPQQHQRAPVINAGRAGGSIELKLAPVQQDSHAMGPRGGSGGWGDDFGKEEGVGGGWNSSGWGGNRNDGGSGSGGRGGNGSSNGNGNGSAGSSPLRLPSIEGGDDDDELYRGMGS